MKELNEYKAVITKNGVVESAMIGNGVAVLMFTEGKDNIDVNGGVIGAIDTRVLVASLIDICTKFPRGMKLLTRAVISQIATGEVDFCKKIDLRDDFNEQDADKIIDELLEQILKGSKYGNDD